jgi:hypothetical protein
MNLADVWREVPKRIGFFTKETRELIPETPGFYAWFLPLWLYDQNPSRFVQIVESVFLCDRDRPHFAEDEATVQLNWDSIGLAVRRVATARVSPNLEALWSNVIGNPGLKATFEQALMQASILLPPLYVGKADSLRVRYDQHVSATSLFCTRFTRYCQHLGLQISVTDLLFVCIETPFIVAAEHRDPALNFLLEQLVMALSRPPFSMR